MTSETSRDSLVNIIVYMCMFIIMGYCCVCVNCPVISSVCLYRISLR